VSDPSPPIRNRDDLLAPFWEAMRPSAAHRIGVESEKFGVVEASGAPIHYERHVVPLFEALSRDAGWQPLAERTGGPVIALERQDEHGRVSITLEPGAQLELSGAPVADLHAVRAELDAHLAELAAPSAEQGITWLSLGFHPLARPDELGWVPKERYAIMREYFPRVGGRGLDMMRRTATVQVNLDYADESDALRKLRVALRLSPLVTAMFANAPFVEGAVTGRKSERAAVWLDVDPDRTGLLPAMLSDDATLEDYVDWALAAPMYLFKRDGRVVANTGQAFRSFWQDGWHGERASIADWELHLNTLFPEVRLKRTLELRGADAQSRALHGALPALGVGLLYDARALDEAEALSGDFTHDELLRLRPEVVRHGLEAPFRGAPLRGLAEEVVAIALGGLERRARPDATGADERRHLEPLARLVERGRSPADLLLADLDAGFEVGADRRAEILRRSAV
jgi:glutamate--cysteine ligase